MTVDTSVLIVHTMPHGIFDEDCSYHCPCSLMLFSRVINNEICFPNKEVYNVYEMFHTRFSLFKRIYTHRVSKAIEYMIVDALLAADHVLNISDSIQDPSAYTRMTDDILTEIEKSSSDVRFY